MALDEARRMLAYQASREPASAEQAVGDVLVTAHHAAEVLRNEANEEADNLLAEARQQARTIVAEAERQLSEVDAAKVQGERAVAELHAEARRVHLVIDEFRNQWWNLISEALEQLELRVSTAGAPVEEAEILHDDLRRRLAETLGEDGTRREGTGDSEIETHGEIGSS